MTNENNESYKKMTRYVLLGSFLGGVVGTTLAIVAFPQSADEKKKNLLELQKDLLKPIKVKLIEIVEYIGDTLKKAIDESGKMSESNRSIDTDD